MDNETQAILLSINVAGWQTGMVGGRNVVEFWARDRQTGEVLTSQAPASHADDAVRWLAQRCGLDQEPL